MNISDGLAKEENEQNRRNLYLDVEKKYDEWEPYSISEYRNNDTALCTERAAIAQNMLAFLGADTYYVMGHLSRNDGLINMNHAYNVIVDTEFGSGIIVDFTNPVLRQSQKERYVFQSNIINKDSVKDFLIGKHKEENKRSEFYFQDDKEYRKTSYCLYSLNELSKEEIHKLQSKQSSIEEVDIAPTKQITKQQTLSKMSIRNVYIDSAIDVNEIQNGQNSLKEEINNIYQKNPQQVKQQSKDDGINR